MLSDYAAIAGNIQFAIAPVFLIAGVGALLNVMTSRLARVVDRGRALEQALAEPGGEAMREAHLAELAGLDTRMRRINRAILLSTFSCLLTCLVIVALFAGELIRADLSTAIATLFIAAMLALIAGLIAFLGGIAFATRFLRIAREYRRAKP